MANQDNSKIVKIYGVTLAPSGNRLDSYGHGTERVGVNLISYVDYNIDNLVLIIKRQDLADTFIKKLKE